MKLNQFRNIIAIAERGSLRAAARHLGLAQPALSRSVQELEHELGVQLFERRARGTALTPIGEALVRRAENVMTEVRRAREEVEQLRGGTSGTVAAAMSIVPHLTILPRVLRPFHARYPKAELHLIEGLYPTVEAGLQDGSIDFYVGPPPERDFAASLVQEKLFDNQRNIFCRKGHPLAGARTLADLAGAEWLTTSITYSAEAELRDLFVRHRLPMPRLALRSQSALTMLVSLANSDFLAMVPRQWAEFPLTADALVKIEINEPLPAPPIVIIRRAGLPLTPAAEYFCDLVRRYRPRDDVPAPSRPSRRR
ncbi:MAG TPA: LysR substrate-binding domain-containing protein [Hyphomicrobiales bacterium]|nr:LysR substrate-binding domain-containing protein [Hyphomicrobiales bacterium]